MIKVGLTGNIGSGKSTVANIFSLIGVPVYNADKEAGKFLDNKLIAEIIAAIISKDILKKNKKIDKKKLASIIFNDKQKLWSMNAIIHPLVMSDFSQWSDGFGEQKYVINESAVLVETGLYRKFDRIITVTAPEELRIERVMKRDRCDRMKVTERIKNQLAEKEIMNVSDHIIVNNDKTLVLPQLLKIHAVLST